MRAPRKGAGAERASVAEGAARLAAGGETASLSVRAAGGRAEGACTQVALPPPETALALLLAVAGPELAAAALPLVRARLRLTPEKLALVLCRLLNPDEILGEAEEQKVRGLSDKTLKGMKDGRELPRVLQGVPFPPK